MITELENERLVRVGSGTPMGELLRRYWMPACLSEELPRNDGDPIRVRLVGEDLVAFRDSTGSVGLIGALCPHRGAPLFLGRNEECGIRCVYHGWKFDTSGNCVDMPSESRETFKLRIKALSYPTWEGGGIVWTYMGPPERTPSPPAYEWLRTPPQFLRVSKTGEACNFLQGLEGGIDTAHVSFAHNNDMSTQTLLKTDLHPSLELDRTPYGYRYAGIRTLADEKQYVRVNLLILPLQQLRVQPMEGMSEAAYAAGHIWVPIDDENTFVYNTLYCQDGSSNPISDSEWEMYEAWFGRGKDDYHPNSYWLRADGSNDFMIDRDLQRRKTFTGITGVNTQDFAIQVGMGPIVDRTKEHPGTTDRAILSARRIYFDLMNAVEAGEDPTGLEPESHQDLRAAEGIIPKGEAWRDALKEDLCSMW